MKKKYKLFIGLSILGAILILLLVLTLTRVKTVNVSGNVYYSGEQIEKLVFKKDFDRAPIVILFKSIFNKSETIPFVESYNVSLTSLNSANITITPKKMMGYIAVIGSNLYFNRDGMVVESDHGIYPNIPQITGLNIDHVILGEQLPVESNKVLNELLEITQYLASTSVTLNEKNEYLINIVSGIHFSTGSHIDLYVNNVQVSLGNGYNLEEKLHEMADILPSIYDKEGILHLEEYDSSSSSHMYRFE